MDLTLGPKISSRAPHAGDRAYRKKIEMAPSHAIVEDDEVDSCSWA
jgi:hypothetical protein